MATSGFLRGGSRSFRAPDARTLAGRPLRYSGRSYKSFLTALSPIEPAGDGEGKLNALLDVFADNQQDRSPFRECTSLHFARLQVIDRVRSAMGDRKGETLKSKYLLFLADVDGEIDDFLDCLYRTRRDFVHAVWGRCIGYPAYDGPVFFRRYIHRCVVPTHLPFAGFPETTVGETLDALDAQGRLANWVDAHHRDDPEELLSNWRDFVAELDARPPPRPGGRQSDENAFYTHVTQDPRHLGG